MSISFPNLETLKAFKKKIRTRMTFEKRVIFGKVHGSLDSLIQPDDDMLVLALVLSCQNMALEVGQYVEFAPMQGMIGPAKLWGNSLPVFEYTVFYKPLMEFVKIIVEIAKPDRISFLCTIDSLGTQDPKRHGEELEVIDEFTKPFFKLAHHLYNYFPHYREPACRQHRQVEVIPVQEVRSGAV